LDSNCGSLSVEVRRLGGGFRSLNTVSSLVVMRLIGQDLFDLERVYARQVPGEDAVDELVGEVGEDELAFRQLGVLDRLNDADDACVQRIDREAYHAKTTRAVTPRQVRQLLQPSTVHTPANSTKMLVDLSFFAVRRYV